MSETTPDVGLEYGRHWTDIAAAMEGGLADGLSDRICRADSPDEVVTAVLDEAEKSFKHCALFRTSHDTATIWDWRGWKPSPMRVAGFAVPSTSGNPLELLVIHRAFRGATPVEHAYLSFFEEMGIPYPHEMVLYPVEVAGRVIAFFYADNGASGRIDTIAKDEMALVKRLGLGLTLVLFKQKVRSIGA